MCSRAGSFIMCTLNLAQMHSSNISRAQQEGEKHVLNTHALVTMSLSSCPWTQVSRKPPRGEEGWGAVSIFTAPIYSPVVLPASGLLSTAFLCVQACVWLRDWRQAHMCGGWRAMSASASEKASFFLKRTLLAAHCFIGRLVGPPVSRNAPVSASTPLTGVLGFQMLELHSPPGSLRFWGSKPTESSPLQFPPAF